MFSDMPYLSNNDIAMMLPEYDELGFEDIPKWLRDAIINNGITFTKRPPTPQEMDETIIDAKIHRVTHNERTIEDFKDKYIHKISPFTGEQKHV